MLAVGCLAGGATSALAAGGADPQAVADQMAATGVTSDRVAIADPAAARRLDDLLAWADRDGLEATED